MLNIYSKTKWIILIEDSKYSTIYLSFSQQHFFSVVAMNHPISVYVSRVPDGMMIIIISHYFARKLFLNLADGRTLINDDTLK